MKKALGLVLLVPCLVVGAHAARANGLCPPPGYVLAPPAVEMDHAMAEPVYRHDEDRDTIAGRAAGSLAMAVPGFVSGLTLARMHFGVQAVTMHTRLPDGRYCFWLHSVKGTWSLADITVFVAREYEAGSCEHRTILAHENRHVAIHRQVFLDHRDRMHQALRRAARAMGPLVTASPDGAKFLTERLTAAVRPELKAAERAARRANAAIDTPESYRAVSARCANW